MSLLVCFISDYEKGGVLKVEDFERKAKEGECEEGLRVVLAPLAVHPYRTAQAGQCPVSGNASLPGSPGLLSWERRWEQVRHRGKL